MPFTLDDLLMFVAKLDQEDSRHRTKGYRLGHLHIEDMIAHLREEIVEFQEAAPDDKPAELCDILGVVLHIAARLEMTPLETACMTRNKLLKRFEVAGFDESVRIPMEDCPRCGRNHDVIFKRMENPVGEFQFFAMCPVLKQPILMRAVHEDQPISHKDLIEAAATFADSIDQLEQQRDELAAQLCTMDANLLAIIDMIPEDCVVRVREGGGPESPLQTLHLSISKLVDSLP